MYITKMYIVNLAIIFLVVLVPSSFGNNEPTSTSLLNRIEALERRDKEQTSKIDTLEPELILSNKKLTIFSALNEGLQKDISAKTKKLEEQDDVIATLVKDVELQKTEAGENRRKIEILDLKVRTLGARLEERDELFIQPDKNLEELNEIKAQLNGTGETPDRDNSVEKELRAIQANQEFTANKNDDRGAESIAAKLLGKITGNTSYQQVYGKQKNAQIDKEQASKIDTLEQELILSNKKLTIFSALNEGLQKDISAKTKKLEEQDDVIATLVKDVELQKTEAGENRRKIEILDLKVRTLGARLEERDELFIQPDKNLEELNEIKAQLNGTGETPDRDNSVEKELRAIQANQEFTANKNDDRGAESIAAKLLGKITGNTSYQQVYGKQKNAQIERHAIQRFVADGSQEGPAAFHAVISRGLVEHLGIDQNIVFDLVELNLAGGYHNQHGLFIAPKSGIYIFSTTILSYINAKSEFKVQIVKNGNILASAFCHGDSGRHDQGSVTVVTQLNVGDEISVKNRFVADGSLYGDKYSSFMGILVIEM